MSLQTNVPQVAPELQSLQNEMSQLQMELSQLENQVSQLKAQQESGQSHNKNHELNGGGEGVKKSPKSPWIFATYALKSKIRATNAFMAKF